MPSTTTAVSFNSNLRSRSAHHAWGKFACLALLGCSNLEPEVIREVPVPGGGGASDGTEASGRAGAGGEAGSSTGEGGLGGGSGSAGAISTIPKLSDSHPGYGQALCFDCHGTTAPYPHSAVTYRPPDCASCHGVNGAPQRDHAVVENPGCPNCHGVVAHVPKFQAPTDCVRCHNPR